VTVRDRPTQTSRCLDVWTRQTHPTIDDGVERLASSALCRAALPLGLLVLLIQKLPSQGALCYCGAHAGHHVAAPTLASRVCSAWPAATPAAGAALWRSSLTNGGSARATTVLFVSCGAVSRTTGCARVVGGQGRGAERTEHLMMEPFAHLLRLRGCALAPHAAGLRLRGG
jgi:hypothetical protein